MNTYFVLSLVSIIAAMGIIGMKVCFASKCEEFSVCFGLFSVKRNVVIEEKEFHGRVSESFDNIKQMKNEIGLEVLHDDKV